MKRKSGGYDRLEQSSVESRHSRRELGFVKQAVGEIKGQLELILLKSVPKWVGFESH